MRTVFLSALLTSTLLLGCKDAATDTARVEPDYSAYGFESTGEEFLVNALDELHRIADWEGPSSGRVCIVVPGKTAADTTYVYGELTPEGYGAVVTERHTYPKNLLLITVRKSYGRSGGRTATETKRYISEASFRNDQPEQTNITEVYALSRDTIVTRVFRNSTLETYTFRLPVVTRTLNADPAVTRVVSRFGDAGTVVSETRDGNDVLIQSRRTYGMADGSLVTRTEYADGTWRQSVTLGCADGTVLHEVTTSPLPD